MTQQLDPEPLEDGMRGVGCYSRVEGWGVSIRYSSDVVVGAGSVVGVAEEGVEGIFLCTEVDLHVWVCRVGVDLHVEGDQTSASWQV